MNYFQKLYEASKFVYELVIESLITFDERFKVPSVPFFIPDFNLLSCESEDFTFKVLY